jgi:hypothetical protein
LYKWWVLMIFGFLSLVYPTQHDDLQSIHFPANDMISFFFMAEWYCIYMYI